MKAVVERAEEHRALEHLMAKLESSSISRSRKPPAARGTGTNTGSRNRRGNSNNNNSNPKQQRVTSKGGRGARRPGDNTTRGTASQTGTKRDSRLSLESPLDSYSGSEMEERMANNGFTDYELNDLLCQGVKPWDDDAWVSINLTLFTVWQVCWTDRYVVQDVLAALSY